MVRVAIVLLACGCGVPGGSLQESDARVADASLMDVALDAIRIDAPTPVDVGGEDAGDDASSTDVGVDAGELDAGDDAVVSEDAGCVTTEEVCNGFDDDCDGFIDEEGCAGCTRVESPGVPSHVYLLCDDVKRNWDEGDSWCAGLGYRLADVQAELEHGFVWMRAQSVRDDHWWIGLRETDGWRWTRGEAAHPSAADAYNGWIAGDPGDELCARLKKDTDGVEATFSDGGWESKPCSDNHYVVCEVGG